MNQPIRVLQVSAGSQNFGGVSKFVYEVYKGIDKDKVQFDILSPKKTTYEAYRSKIEGMGANIYELKIDDQRKGIRFYIELFFKTLKFLKNHQYSIIHINSGIITFNLAVALAAKLKGVKRVIAHSHSVKIYRNKIDKYRTNIEKIVIRYLATDYFACSKTAAESMFTSKLITDNKVRIIKNGIQTEKFKFNSDIREEYRKKMGIKDRFVIGHIGRFCEEKNHKYLIDIFREINRINKNAMLLLIGEGELEEKIKRQVKEYNLEDYVMFLGLRKDVSQLMQAMDMFVFPSKREGLGIVLIEAQAASLPTLASDVVPLETNITKHIKYLSLKEDPICWSKEIDKFINYTRKEDINEIKNQGFDIENTCRELQEIYIKGTQEEK